MVLQVYELKLDSDGSPNKERGVRTILTSLARFLRALRI